jgi:uncharacterized protein YoxC
MQQPLTTSRMAFNATLTPKRFFGDKERLREYPILVIVLISSIVITLFFLPLVWAWEMSLLGVISNSLNVGIYAVGIGGVYASLLSIARIEIEIATAVTITSRIHAETSPGELDLHKLSEKFVPQNACTPSLATKRLFEHICREARNLRYDSAVNVVQSFYEESADNLLEIINLQKIALRGGIFATFIGLLLALQQLPSWASLDLGSLLGKFGSVLFISFSGSVVGLQVAITLGILLIILRKKQIIFYQHLVEMAASSLDLVRDARKNNEDVIISELSDVRSSVDELIKRLYDHGERITGVISGTTVSIKSQNTIIQEGIDELKQSKVSYQDLLSEVSTSQKRFIEEVKEVYKNLSLGEFRSEMKAGLVEAGTRIADTMKSTTDVVAEQTSVIEGTSSDFVKATSNLSEFLDRMNIAQQEFVENVKKAQDVDPLLRSNADLHHSLNQLRDDVSRLSHTVRTLDASVNESVWSRIFGIRKRK